MGAHAEQVVASYMYVVKNYVGCLGREACMVLNPHRGAWLEIKLNAQWSEVAITV